MKNKVLTKTQTKLKKKNNKNTVRQYNNTKRREKVDLNKQKIIQLYVDMLVKANGEDVTLQMLAKKSKISLRTLFRFFGDKNSLNLAIEDYMSQYFQSVGQAMGQMVFVDYVEYTYKIFDQYEKMFTAYLLTNFGQKSRAIFRQKFYSLLLLKIQHELQLGELSSLTTSQQKKLKFIVALVNAQIWKDMKDSFELSGTEVSETIRWAIETLLADFKK